MMRCQFGGRLATPNSSSRRLVPSKQRCDALSMPKLIRFSQYTSKPNVI